MKKFKLERYSINISIDYSFLTLKSLFVTLLLTNSSCTVVHTFVQLKKINWFSTLHELFSGKLWEPNGFFFFNFSFIFLFLWLFKPLPTEKQTLLIILLIKHKQLHNNKKRRKKQTKRREGETDHIKQRKKAGGAVRVFFPFSFKNSAFSFFKLPLFWKIIYVWLEVKK